jgi:hypothetical protein
MSFQTLSERLAAVESRLAALEAQPEPEPKTAKVPFHQRPIVPGERRWPNDGETQCDTCVLPVEERDDSCRMPHYGECYKHKPAATQPEPAVVYRDSKGNVLEVGRKVRRNGEERVISSLYLDYGGGQRFNTDIGSMGLHCDSWTLIPDAPQPVGKDANGTPVYEGDVGKGRYSGKSYMAAPDGWESGGHIYKYSNNQREVVFWQPGPNRPTTERR